MTGPVSVLVPARDEADTIGACLASVRAQRAVPDLEIVVLDDGSTDAHGRGGARRSPRPIPGSDWSPEPTCPPAGWASRTPAISWPGGPARRCSSSSTPMSCWPPDAVAAAVGLLDGFDLASPYPRIVGAGRLVQPLLQWSWLTFLPLRAMERSPRPSLAAAGGQFLVGTAGRPTSGPAATPPSATGCSRTSSWPGRSSAPADASRIADGSRAGHRPDVQRRGPTWSPATPSRSGRRSARAWSAAAVGAALLMLYAVPPRGRRRGRRGRRLGLGRRGGRGLRCSGSPGAR